MATRKIKNNAKPVMGKVAGKAKYSMATIDEIRDIETLVFEKCAKLAEGHDRFDEAKSGDTDASAYAKGHGKACQEIADAIREANPHTSLNMNVDNWHEFDGDYSKDWYDVRLPDGKIIKHCWPNAGFMVATDGTGREWKPGECEVALSITHPMDGSLIVR